MGRNPVNSLTLPSCTIAPNLAHPKAVPVKLRHVPPPKCRPRGKTEKACQNLTFCSVEVLPLNGRWTPPNLATQLVPLKSGVTLARFATIHLPLGENESDPTQLKLKSEIVLKNLLSITILQLDESVLVSTPRVNVVHLVPLLLSTPNKNGSPRGAGQNLILYSVSSLSDEPLPKKVQM